MEMEITFSNLENLSASLANGPRGERWKKAAMNQQWFVQFENDIFSPLKYLVHVAEDSERPDSRDLSSSAGQAKAVSELQKAGFERIDFRNRRGADTFRQYLVFFNRLQIKPDENRTAKRHQYFEDGSMIFWIKRIVIEQKSADTKPLPAEFRHANSIGNDRTDEVTVLSDAELLSSADFQEKVWQSSNDSQSDRLARLAKASGVAAKSFTTTISYNRNFDVVAEALFRANGVCEDCGKDAPFRNRRDNRPFLEVHHVIPLSENGPDTLDNVRPVCPNCHRKAHYG